MSYSYLLALLFTLYEIKLHTILLNMFIIVYIALFCYYMFIFRFLDVSQANQTYGMFECPDTTLANLVQSLPNLTSLDISGTNLSGDGTFDEYRESDTVKTTL